MSDRERKLLIFFGVAIFLVANFFAYSLISKKQQEVASEVTKLEGVIREAEEFEAMEAQVRDEMQWLEDREPEPVEAEPVGPKLEQFANARATSAGLTVKKRTILPDDETGPSYWRARVEMQVSGMEQALYRWLSQLQDPNRFRAVTALRMSPNREDDTLIDANVVVEEWFIPVLADNAELPPASE